MRMKYIKRCEKGGSLNFGSNNLKNCVKKKKKLKIIIEEKNKDRKRNLKYIFSFIFLFFIYSCNLKNFTFFNANTFHTLAAHVSNCLIQF